MAHAAETRAIFPKPGTEKTKLDVGIQIAREGFGLRRHFVCASFGSGSQLGRDSEQPEPPPLHIFPLSPKPYPYLDKDLKKGSANSRTGRGSGVQIRFEGSSGSG